MEGPIEDGGKGENRVERREMIGEKQMSGPIAWPRGKGGKGENREEGSKCLSGRAGREIRKKRREGRNEKADTNRK